MAEILMHELLDGQDAAVAGKAEDFRLAHLFGSVQHVLALPAWNCNSLRTRSKNSVARRSAASSSVLKSPERCNVVGRRLPVRA